MKSFATVIFVLLFMAWSGTGMAQQQQGAASSQGQSDGQGGPGILVKADSVKGTAVIDSSGQNLGKVDSVALDLFSGKISYVVVNPGSGDKLVPVPYDMFGVKSDKRLVLGVDKNKLDAAPSYAKSSQPNWTNPQWAQQVVNFWGKIPSGIVAARTSPSTASSSQQPATMSTSQQPPASSQQPTTMGGGSTQPAGQGATGNQTQQPMGSGSTQPPPGGQRPMGQGPAQDQPSQPMGSGQPTPQTSTGTTGT